MILGPDFVSAIERLLDGNPFKQWLAIGQRTDLEVDRAIDFDCPAETKWLDQHCQAKGSLSSRVCKEFFAFPRQLYRDVPAFAVGRGNWDNWMVANAKANRIPVIDLSEKVTAIHQTHGYSHINSSRMKCYVNGEEARNNQRLAGGRNLIFGSTCNHRLVDDGIKKIGIARAACDFLRDSQKFAKLMLQLLFGRS